MNLFGVRSIKHGAYNFVAKAYAGTQKIWPKWLSFEGDYWWPVDNSSEFPSITETKHGYVMSVVEFPYGTNNNKIGFLIAVGLPFHNSNTGRIKIFSYQTDTKVFKQHSFLNAALADGGGTNYYYGKSMSWAEGSFSLIVGAPCRQNLKGSSTTGGAIRIFRMDTSENNPLDSFNFKFALLGEHYNYGTTTVNNTSGWITGVNWYGSHIQTFGWSVALDFYAECAYVSAPDVGGDNTGVGWVLKRDYNSYLNKWEEIYTRDLGPNQFYFCLESTSGVLDFPVDAASWFGAEILCYKTSVFDGGQFLIVKTANNSTVSPVFEHNSVFVFKTRRENNRNNPVPWRIIADKNPSTGKHTSFGWSDTSGNFRQTIAAGDRVVVIGSPSANKVYIFDSEPGVSPTILTSFNPKLIITPQSAGFTHYITGFGSTVSCSRSSFVTEPSRVVISHINWVNTANIGGFTAYIDLGSDKEWYPHSQTVLEEDYGIQEFSAYCTFISSKGDYIISTVPQNDITLVSTTTTTKIDIGSIKILKGYQY